MVALTLGHATRGSAQAEGWQRTVATDSSRISGLGERGVRTRRLLEEVISRRLSGETVSDDAVIAAHPELMPDLADELRELASVEQARQRAALTTTATPATEATPIGANAEGAPQRAGRPLPPPDAVPGYEFLREIHRGGQGVVFLAIQKSTRRKVAVKIMHSGAFGGSAGRARFEREVKLLGAVTHPNIVAIHDSGVAPDGSYFFVMDYISGDSLDVWMAADHGVDETLRLFVRICEAVNAAHLKGVIHRDLKPGNIRIDSKGEPFILDFGLAKIAADSVTERESADGAPRLMSVTGQFIGTLAWASPEQAAGSPDQIDLRTDVYSLGVLLYQMLTHRFPYEVVGNWRDVLDNILKAAPTRPSTVRRQINAEVETIVLKCLQKERERRYQSAGELARDVQRYLHGEPIEAKRDSALYVIRKKIVRHRRAVLAAVVLLAVVGTAFGAITSQRREASQQRLLNEQQREAERDKAAKRAAADRKLIEAEPFIRGRTELHRAHAMLDEAVALAPELERAYLSRGLVHALEGLAAQTESKSYYVERALADFERAHCLAGGMAWSQAAASQPSGSLAGGLPQAVWAAIDLLILADRESEAHALLDHLALMGFEDDAFGANRTPIYNIGSDPLIRKQPPRETPEMARARADETAELHRILRADVTTLDPRRVNSAEEYIADLIFERLFVPDVNMLCMANPALVASYSSSPDGTVWTVALQPQATWHDGTPFTANDVVYSWQQLDELRRAPLALVRAVDAHTVEFTHRERTATALWDMSFDLIPPHHVDALATNPIGNGAFAFKSREGDTIILERWEGYQGVRPHFRRIVFRLLPADRRAERIGLLADGEADEAQLTGDEFRWDVNGDSFAREVYKLTADRWQYEYIGWNLDEGSLLADRRVRRAIAHAVDLDAIRTEDYGGLYPRFEGIFAGRPWLAGVPSRVELIPHDPQKAKNLLDEAGWRPGPGGGTRMKNGRPLEFGLLLVKDAIGFERVATRLEAQLAQVGISMRIDRIAGMSEWRERIEKRDFDAVAAAVVANPDPDRDRLRWYSDGRRNNSGYRNPRVDALFDEARRTLDPQAQALIYREIEERIYDDQPYLFLWNKPMMWAFNNRVRGVDLSPIGPDRYYPGVRAWWTAPDR